MKMSMTIAFTHPDQLI